MQDKEPGTRAVLPLLFRVLLLEGGWKVKKIQIQKEWMQVSKIEDISETSYNE